MGGTVVRRATDSPTFHACYPPDCHEHAGTWVLNRGGFQRWTTGDVWRCDCGFAWEVSRGPSLGLWDTWVRAWKHDGPAAGDPAAMSTGQIPDRCPFPKVVWFDPAALELLIRCVGLLALALVFCILAWLGFG